VAIGDYNGHVGLGVKCSKEVDFVEVLAAEVVDEDAVVVEGEEVEVAAEVAKKGTKSGFRSPNWVDS